MTQAQRGEYGTYLRSGWRRNGGPDGGVALQFKFNPNHDPADRLFTFADGASSGGKEIVVNARRPPADDPPKPAKGPFRHRAGEVGIDGETRMPAWPSTSIRSR